MIPETLTIIERQILANQYKILAKLEQDQSHEIKVEILENGYTGEYDQIFSVDTKEVSSEICEETNEILNMYRRITNSIARLTEEEKQQLDLERIEFEGFDGNHDDHYSYMTFMVEEMEKWREYKGLNLNSHSQLTLTKYRRMLEYQKELLVRQQYDLTFNDLQRLIELS